MSLCPLLPLIRRHIAWAPYPRSAGSNTDNGCDEFFERLAVLVLRQALMYVGEVEPRVLVRHLGEHFEEDAPAMS